MVVFARGDEHPDNDDNSKNVIRYNEIFLYNGFETITQFIDTPADTSAIPMDFRWNGKNGSNTVYLVEHQQR